MIDLQFNGVSAAPPQVLIVEDDAALRGLMIRALRAEGFNALSARSGPEMARMMQDNHVDVVLLDVMLPGASGLDLCRNLRRVSDIPVIMVSARGDESDRLVGLEIGADDYMVKPFSTKELVARIRALLRRAQGGKRTPPGDVGDQLSFAGWTVSLGRRQVISPEGAQVELSAAEFDLLVAFLSHPMRIIGRERLLELSRARITDASDRSVDVLVSRLRRKLSSEGDVGPLIRTMRGIGYMFSVPVQRA